MLPLQFVADKVLDYTCNLKQKVRCRMDLWCYYGVSTLVVNEHHQLQLKEVQPTSQQSI